MSRFTGDEFETALEEVYPSNTWESHFSKECKSFLKDILTSDPEKLDIYIGNNKATMIACINSIMGSTEKNDLTKFIKYIHHHGITSDNISNTMQQGPKYDRPIFHISEKMLQNQEQSALPSTPASSLFASAHPPASTPASAYPPASTIAKHTMPPASTIAKHTMPPASTIAKHTISQKHRIKLWWETKQKYGLDEANKLYHADKHPHLTTKIGGGSRRRRSSHRKRKSYRKSKRVRHTSRKQTRRHRHRRSRHRR